MEHGLLLGAGSGRTGEAVARRVVDRQEGDKEARRVDKDAEVRREGGLDEGGRGDEEGTKKWVEEPRIVVIGDRLFTDTLLAHRLSLHLRASDDAPRVLSILTTRLPEPRDQRLLRWLEERLSGGQVIQGKVDWRTCTRHPIESELAVDENLETARGWIRTRRTSDATSWRLLSLVVGAVRLVSRSVRSGAR